MTNLFNALEQMEHENLTSADMADLLILFSCTKNHALRNLLADIFSKTIYKPALPIIFQKIMDKSNINHTGSLIFALDAFNLKTSLQDLVNVLSVDQSFEALMTLEYVIETHLDSFPQIDKERALAFLLAYRSERSDWDINNYAHYYVNSIINLLNE